jgi:hypothetical protein
LGCGASIGEGISPRDGQWRPVGDKIPRFPLTGLTFDAR